MFGDGSAFGIKMRYVVEPEPLGTGGGIKFASRGIDGPIVVFNGDVLTEIDLGAVIRLHRERHARATIVLTPVENPSAFGLVETDGRQNVQRFIEKPQRAGHGQPDQRRHLRARDRDVRSDSGRRRGRSSASISLADQRGETFLAFDYQGYWIDIGTPEKYLQVHHDILAGRFRAAPFRDQPAPRACVSATARISPEATIESPCFVGDDVTVEAGARVAPLSVIGRGARLDAQASWRRVIWPGCAVGPGATAACHCRPRRRLGANTTVGAGAVPGDGTHLTRLRLIPETAVDTSIFKAYDVRGPYRRN